MNQPAIATNGVTGTQRSHEHTQRRLTHGELVEQYGALVRTVAHRIWRRIPEHARGFEEEDLVSVGVIGLIRAYERYEERDGVSFASFAEFRIKGAMLDEIRRHDFFPRRLRAKANKLQRAEARLEKELGRAASNEEVAEALEMSTAQLAKLRAKIAPYSFVDNQDPCITLQSSFPDPSRVLLQKELREKMVELLKELPRRQQILLDLYFNKDLKLREIGEILEVSEGRVSQLKSAALRHVRGRMEGLGLRLH
jgi:RNA polymerase sigma factor for flagellar operon FliA